MTQNASLVTDDTLSLCAQIKNVSSKEIIGHVFSVQGLTIQIIVRYSDIGIGSRCYLLTDKKQKIWAEVIGFNAAYVIVMLFDHAYGIKPGQSVYFESSQPTIHPNMEWCGRVLNGLAEPIDDLGALPFGEYAQLLDPPSLPATKRARVKERISVGVKAINTFLTCCKGQRMGIFAGSGVGKSTLLSMLAKNTDCDICILALVGERGKEVKDFLEETLGEDGLKKSIVIVATSDEPPLMRRQSAYLALSLADYYRNQGLSVLCLVDSVTRFAMAQREIGLSAGEPPTTKGYTPSVFTQLAQLLERAGPGLEDHPNSDKTGYVTGLFTVLVDGDDTNEPISDAVRGIVDGHIILDRKIAEQGRFPAIDITKSISRTVPGCHLEHEKEVVKQARKYIALYEDMQDMIRLGAYRKGSDADVDKAITLMKKLHSFLSQTSQEKFSIEASFKFLQECIN
ncbi:MAG: flagellum-specific ATP synthase FliI [Candidatus Puniceispirillum sp.]|nr:flagellum-specific ATP synthase FliI [Candidatus Pelagibacter sp.]MBA4283113.1 flagellum-specific ATP synthase FliI [Candidatus Puniceispirillum sp.]